MFRVAYLIRMTDYKLVLAFIVHLGVLGGVCMVCSHVPERGSSSYTSYRY